MSMRPEEISSIIKDQIKNYKSKKSFFDKMKDILK